MSTIPSCTECGKTLAQLRAEKPGAELRPCLGCHTVQYCTNTCWRTVGGFHSYLCDEQHERFPNPCRKSREYQLAQEMDKTLKDIREVLSLHFGPKINPQSPPAPPAAATTASSATAPSTSPEPAAPAAAATASSTTAPSTSPEPGAPFATASSTRRQRKDDFDISSGRTTAPSSGQATPRPTTTASASGRSTPAPAATAPSTGPGPTVDEAPGVAPQATLPPGVENHEVLVYITFPQR